MVQKIAQCFSIVKQNFEQIATLSFGEKEFLNERECVLNIPLEFRNSREGIIIISPQLITQWLMVQKFTPYFSKLKMENGQLNLFYNFKNYT